MITLEQLSDWKRLADAATEGPWETDTTENEGDYGNGLDLRSGFNSYEVAAASGRVCDTINSDVAMVSEEYDEDGCTAWDEVGKANMEFIAAARTAVPTLIAEVERLTAERDALKEALDFYAKEHQRPNDGPWGVNSTDFGAIARKALEAKP